jgi:hypothetical protein
MIPYTIRAPPIVTKAPFNAGPRCISNTVGDPIEVPYANFGNPQSLNLYTYGKNNPTTFGDPDGHDPPVPGTAALPLAAGGSISISQAFWTLGSVLLPGMIGGGVAYYGMDTVASNNYVKADATIESVHATNQLAMAQNNANKSTPPPPPGGQVDPKRPRTKGKPDHQETVKDEAQRIGGEAEVRIPTPGGNKDTRVADAAQTDGNGNYVAGGQIVQVIRPTAAGNVPKREQEAAQDLQNATGVKPQLVPVRPEKKGGSH